MRNAEYDSGCIGGACNAYEGSAAFSGKFFSKPAEAAPAEITQEDLQLIDEFALLRSEQRKRVMSDVGDMLRKEMRILFE